MRVIEGVPQNVGPHGWLLEEMTRFITDWTKRTGAENYWLDPLVAVASAKDPMLYQLRRVVDPEHAMPVEIMPEAQAVIVFFLPFRRWLGEENDRQKNLAARSWAESYVTTNRLIRAVNQHLKGILEAMGYLAETTPPTHNFDLEKLVSRWSHKHLAYIAGLGTFGHHHLLITPAGCCGRLGSLVTSMPIAATKRPTEEWCLLKAGHTCLACVSKCRFDALHKSRFNRQVCYQQCLKTDAHYSDLPLVDVCGKCACEVPCSYQIPALPLKETTHR
jgi:epoxyqueuosine reductase